MSTEPLSLDSVFDLADAQKDLSDPNTSPRNAVYLHLAFHNYLHEHGLVATENPQHQCRSGQCVFFHKGRTFVCCATGRVHHCTADDCRHKEAPPPLRVGREDDQYSIRQSAHLVCAITGTVYPHEEYVLNFVEQQERVEDDQAPDEEPHSKRQRERQRREAADTKRQLDLGRSEACANAITDVFDPTKGDVWKPHIGPFTQRLEALVHALNVQPTETRKTATALIYLLATGIQGQTGSGQQTILRAYPDLVKWVIPEDVLVNRNTKRFKWLNQMEMSVRLQLLQLFVSKPGALAST
jgi:hypothetical protein